MQDEKSKRDEIQSKILELLKGELNGTLGNVTLMKKLKLNADEFFDIRKDLVDANSVTTGKGRGGSTIINPEFNIEENDEILGSTDDTIKTKEFDLYEPLAFYLNNYWIKDYAYADNNLVEITANIGKTKARGKWSIPDIVLLSKRNYLFTKGVLELTTFEVKPKGYIYDIPSVFETAAHSTFAHKSYLMLHADNNDIDTIETSEVAYLCKQFGIGLILFKDPKKFDSFVFIQEAQKKNPDPERMDFFLRNHLKEQSRHLIISWLL